MLQSTELYRCSSSTEGARRIRRLGTGWWEGSTTHLAAVMATRRSFSACPVGICAAARAPAFA